MQVKQHTEHFKVKNDKQEILRRYGPFHKNAYKLFQVKSGWNKESSL